MTPTTFHKLSRSFTAQVEANLGTYMPKGAILTYHSHHDILTFSLHYPDDSIMTPDSITCLNVVLDYNTTSINSAYAAILADKLNELMTENIL